MPTERADTDEPSHDLDRALAEAMTKGAVEADQTTSDASASEGGESSVLKWSSPGSPRHSKKAVIGIDYSPGHMTLVELQHSRQPAISSSSS